MKKLKLLTFERLGDYCCSLLVTVKPCFADDGESSLCQYAVHVQLLARYLARHQSVLVQVHVVVVRAHPNHCWVDVAVPSLTSHSQSSDTCRVQQSSAVTRILGAQGAESVKCASQFFLGRGPRGLTVKCRAVEQLMPKQVGNKNRKKLNAMGYFRLSFITLYYTHFCGC